LVSGNIALSICIPLISERRELMQTLENISIGIPKDFEIEIILSFDGINPIDSISTNYESISHLINVVSTPKKQGAASARNRAVEKSRGQFLLFLDSDVVLPVDFLEKWSKSVWQNETYYSARVLPINPNSIISLTFGVIALAKNYRHQMSFIPTACSWLSRELFEKSGFFDEDFKDAAGEDAEFCIRINRIGGEILNSDLVVYHDNPDTIASFRQRALRYARHGYKLHQIHNQIRDLEINQTTNINSLPSSRHIKTEKLEQHRNPTRVLKWALKLLSLLLKKLIPRFVKRLLLEIWWNRQRIKRQFRWKFAKKLIRRYKNRFNRATAEVETQSKLLGLKYSTVDKLYCVLLIFYWRRTYSKAIKEVAMKRKKHKIANYLRSFL